MLGMWHKQPFFVAQQPTLPIGSNASGHLSRETDGEACGSALARVCLVFGKLQSLVCPSLCQLLRHIKNHMPTQQPASAHALYMLMLC